MAHRIKLVLVVVVAIIVLALIGEIIFNNSYKFPLDYKYGVTFSPRYAKYLNLDWQKLYIQILDELQVRNLRIPTYWDILEKEEGKNNFSEVDFMLNQAEKRRARAILVVGVRQPRWPECHVPAWAKKLTVLERREKILQFIKKVVERYKEHPAVWAWQIENEPLFPFFGENCDSPDGNFLRFEVNLIKELDKRPIIITDSGELGFWILPMQLSTIFGTTVYRTTFDPILGYKTYPVLPYLYNVKSFLVRNLFARSNNKTIISELQTEPWLSMKDLEEGTPLRQAELFSLDKFKAHIQYAKQTGFDEIYLWGVEWWYFMDKQGYPQYVEYAKSLF